MVGTGLGAGSVVVPAVVSCAVNGVNDVVVVQYWPTGKSAGRSASMARSDDGHSKEVVVAVVDVSVLVPLTHEHWLFTETSNVSVTASTTSISQTGMG